MNAGGKILNPELFYTENKKNKDHFFNLKAQAWYTMADRFRKTYDWVKNGNKCDINDIISISSNCDNIEKLIYELTAPRKEYTPNGLVKVESKENLKKRGIASPNMADAFVMAYAPKSVSKFIFETF